MRKKPMTSVAVMFLVTMMSDIAVHGVLLRSQYLDLPQLYRSEASQQTYFLHMLLAHLFIAVGMTWMYQEWRKDAPWLTQGLRFGLALMVLMVFPTYMIYYAVQPLPAALVAQQIGFDSVSRMLASLLLAWLNR